jgi:hypothetical protein
MSTIENISKTKAKLPNIPRSEIDLMQAAKSVSETWLASPLTLIYKTPQEFSADSAMYEEQITAALQAKGNRSPLANNLQNMDKQIDKDLSFLKNYLDEAYGKANAPAHYPAFGITKSGKRYVLPTDRDNRSKALDILTEALVESPFKEKTYGLNHWSNIRNSYKSFVAQNIAIAQSLSSSVGAKKELKKEIKKVLNSLVLIIKGNYPETYKTVLREWGFQKEKY